MHFSSAFAALSVCDSCLRVSLHGALNLAASSGLHRKPCLLVQPSVSRHSTRAAPWAMEVVLHPLFPPGRSALTPSSHLHGPWGLSSLLPSLCPHGALSSLPALCCSSLAFINRVAVSSAVCKSWLSPKDSATECSSTWAGPFPVHCGSFSPVVCKLALQPLRLYLLERSCSAAIFSLSSHAGQTHMCSALGLSPGAHC